MQKIHLKIYGQVQGVFFRESTKSLAQKLGLTGWVENMPDGTVEIHAEGETEAINEFLQWVKNGPPMAKVERVENLPISANEKYTGFSIK